MQRRWYALLGALGGVALLPYTPTILRAASPVVNSTVAIVDPYAPAQQAGVTSGGALKVDGSAAGGGAVTVSSGTVTPVAGTTGGASTSFLQPAASDNHANIKNGAGTLYGAVGFNNSVTTNYLRYYDAGSGFNGCNSATNLIAQFQIPASGGFSIQVPVGATFSTGLSVCVTSGYATNDTTNATASAMSITRLYK